MKFGDLLSDAAYLTEQTAQMHDDLEGIGASARRRMNPHAHTSAEEIADTAERIQKRLEKSENLIGMLEKHQTDIAELRTETEHEIIRLKSERSQASSADAVGKIEDQLKALQEQREKLDWMQDSAGEMTDQFRERIGQTEQIFHEIEGHHAHLIQSAAQRREIAKGIVTAPTKIAASAAKRTAKDMLRKANPLDKSINIRDTADHGIESLRLAYRTGKKTINTAKTTVKTVKAVKKAPRVIANTAKRTVNVVAKAAKITTNIVVHVAAALINPFTWIALFMAVVVYVILSIVVILMGGASTQDATQAISYTQQVGMDDVDIDDAREYYRIACEQNKGNFASLINGLYYSNPDLRRSDLVYMERNAAGTVTQYTRGFATPAWKASLINAWMISVPEQEAIAVAYVYLQLQENNAHGTQQQIYQVEYTQDVFNQIVDAAVQWSDTTYPNQQCEQNNCSEHHDSHPNPEFATAQQALNDAIARRDDWNAMVVPRCNEYINALRDYNNTPAAGQPYASQQVENAYAWYEQAVNNWSYAFGRWGLYIDEYLGADMLSDLNSEVSEAQSTLNRTQEYIVTTYRTCDHEHTLHSIGLYTYDKEAVMTALGFSDADKEWENLIELGMNLDLTGGA